MPHTSFRRQIDSGLKVLAYAKSIVGVQVGRDIPYTFQSCFSSWRKANRLQRPSEGYDVQDKGYV